MNRLTRPLYAYMLLVAILLTSLISACSQEYVGVNDIIQQSEEIIDSKSELNEADTQYESNDETTYIADDVNYENQKNEENYSAKDGYYNGVYVCSYVCDTLEYNTGVTFFHPSDIHAFDEGIQAEINLIASNHNAVGVQVAVISDGKVSYTHEFGYALRDIYPMTAEHKIRSASLTKPILAMLAIKLHESGEIDIDADISKYWDMNVRNPYHTDIPITIRQLISHTSSIVERPFPYATSESVHRAQFLDGSIFSPSRPGSIGSWLYSNFAYAVLGMTIEVAVGETVNDLANRLLFYPLDIDAAFGAGSITDTNMVAALYRQDGSSARTIETQIGLPGSTYPGETGVEFAGGLTISAVDFAKLLAALIGQGEYGGIRILSPESVSMLEASQGSIGGFNQCLSMRHRTNILGQEELFWHTGTAWGIAALASYNPITGNGIVVLTTGAKSSRDGNGMPSICSEISRLIYEYLDA